jgi:hypothetical protein
MIPEKQIKIDVQHIGATEYTIEIDLKTPKGFTLVAPSHGNRLHISYEHEEKPGEQQSHIIRENPDFPLGVPVRSKGEDAVILIDYEFEFYRNNQPENQYTTRIQYVLPVHIEDSGKDQIHLNAELPLAGIAR